MADLAELFARDPLDLTRADLVTIATELRKQRAAFALGEKAAGKTPKPKKNGGEKITLNLAELGLITKDPE